MRTRNSSKPCEGNHTLLTPEEKLDHDNFFSRDRIVLHYRESAMRLVPLLLCVITVLLALVAFGGASGASIILARILFPIFFFLFLGSLALPGFRAHH